MQTDDLCCVIFFLSNIEVYFCCICAFSVTLLLPTNEHKFHKYQQKILKRGSYGRWRKRGDVKKVTNKARSQQRNTETKKIFTENQRLPPPIKGMQVLQGNGSCCEPFGAVAVAVGSSNSRPSGRLRLAVPQCCEENTPLDVT